MLISATLLATGIVVALGFRFVATRRIESEGLARIQSRNLAQALDQSLTGTLQKIDLALGSVAGEATGTWRNGQLNHPRLEQLLATEGKLLPWPGIIWIADARGRAILGNRPIALVPSWESRWWFLYCRTHPDAGMVVSKPIIGFLTKKWVIPCVRRFNLPNGEFGGVVVIPLSLDYLKSRLSGYEIGPGGAIMERTICPESFPDLLAAIIVYVAANDPAVGVPKIVPVVLFIDTPAGNDGRTKKLSARPPLCLQESLSSFPTMPTSVV